MFIIPAKIVEWWFPEEVEAVVADPVEAREVGRVVDSLALAAEEGAPRYVVRGGGRRRRAQGHRHQCHARQLNRT